VVDFILGFFYRKFNKFAYVCPFIALSAQSNSRPNNLF
jgi:hypothetical protein